MIFSPNDWKVLVAHEGEPDYDAGLDLEGSIGIFTLFGGADTTIVAALTADRTSRISIGMRQASLLKAFENMYGDDGR